MSIHSWLPGAIPVAACSGRNPLYLEIVMRGISRWGLLAAVSAFGIHSTVASATISFNVDFSGSAIGGAPSTESATANTTAGKPTSIALGSYVTAVTTAGFPSGDTANKVMLITANSSNKDNTTNARADVFFRAADSDAVSSGQYKISMTLCFTNLDNGNSNNYFYINLRDGSGSAFCGFGINFNTGYGYLNSASGTNPAFLSNVSKGSTHTFELLVDLDANTQKLVMDGNINLGTSTIKDGITFQQLTINTDTVSQGKLYIDNVTIAQVPEPAALGLLGAGSFGLLSRAKSRLSR